MADLAGLFQATLSPDRNAGLAAELQLRQVDAQPGMLPATLQVIQNDQADAGARQAAAVYLKNRVQTAWTKTDSKATIHWVPEQDKAAVKQHIVQIMATSHPVIKAQLKMAVGAIIAEENFPETWPSFLPQMLAYIGSGDQQQIETGLMCLLEAFRKFQFRILTKDRVVPQTIAAQFLPALLSLANTVLQATPPPAAPENAALILHLIFKVYRSSISNDLSAHHQDLSGSLIPWGTLFLQVVSRPLDPASLPADEDERERCEWWKAKKWAYFNLVRLFSRYGSPSQLHNNLKEYQPFAEKFEAHFAPEIFKTFLKQVELYIQDPVNYWLSERARKIIIDFFDECVKPKSTWNLLREHLPLLLQHFLFPLICPSQEELDEFNDDPVEYTRSHASEIVTDFFTRPSTAVLNLCETLVACRKKSALTPLLSFSIQIMEEYPSKRTSAEKEGAMKIVGHLADHIVVSKQYRDQMEGFFLRYIMPEFSSPHGHLRARACRVAETCEKFDMKWSDPVHINTLFDAIMACMHDPTLPVRVQAASALPELVRYESLRGRVAPNISMIMQDLLQLSNEVDLEVMAETGRKLVEDFSAELAPFADALTSQLVLSFQRIITELNESRESDDANEEKTFSAMGILKTISQLLSSLESSKDILERLEVIVQPAVVAALQHEFIELYDDVFDIIDTLTFHRRVIGPSMWPVFELIHRTFKSDGADYFDSMIASLDNFISFGGDVFAHQPEYLDRLLDIFETTMTSTSLGANDRVQAFKLAESIMLNLRGRADRAVPILLNRATEIISRKNTTEEPLITSSLYLHALELIINGLFYNPQLTIAFLESRSMTGVVFNKWQAKVPRFTRVHDCKLGIMAICTILSSLEGLSNQIKDAAPNLLAIALQQFAKLPQALQHRYKLEREYEEERSNDGHSSDEEETEKADSDVDDNQDFQDRDLDYSRLLDDKVRAKLRKHYESGADDDDLSDDEISVDDDWSEEVLFESPLDKVDVYVEFTKVLQQLQTTQPLFFQRMSQSLEAQGMAQCAQIAQVAQQGGEKVLVAPKAPTAAHARSN